MPAPSFTGQLGNPNSQLGSVVLGGIPFSALPFGFLPHVLDAMTIRVQFNDQVDDSALNPSAYSMLAVSGPAPNYLPKVVSVAFYDADQRSVALTLNQALTYTTVYALSIVGVTSPDGNSVTPSAGNFRANVPNPPLALGAYLSQRGMVDIYFDREVGPTSPGSSANIQATVGGTPQPMTRIPWLGSFPANVLRFELPPTMDMASSYVISYSNVIDASYNTSPVPTQIPLSLLLRAPQPYSYSILSQPQVIDAWVDSISNAPSGYGRALIDVFFNCSMSDADITNTANWTVLSDGTPVPVLAVIDWGSSIAGRAFPATDTCIYFAQVAVPATTATSTYVVTVAARSDDLVGTTNPLDYTGSIAVSPLATPPRAVGTLVLPLQASFRFDQGINLPNLTTVQILGPNGPVRTPDISVTSSLEALVLCLNDLMESYNQHITTPYGAGHLVPDVTNYFLPVEFPGPTIADAITAVNRFRDVYLEHAGSTIYHNYADPDLIEGPYAFDIPSAVNLAQALIQSFSAHNVNVGVHNFAGVSLFSAKLYDTLQVGLGMLDGAPYQLSAQSQYSYIGLGDSSVPMRFMISAPFTGVATSPYVASAIPKQGIVDTNNGVRLEQDAVIVFFSKPIQPAVLTPPDIVITGPTSILTQGYEWINSRVLNIGVINMATAQYSLDIFGVRDQFGNGIVSA